MNVAAQTPVIVLLAAGESRRFGTIKQLAQIDGEPMCRHVARQLLSLGVPLLVVTGAGANAVEAALAGLPLEIVRHHGWAQGLGSSIACGVHHVIEHHHAVSGAMVCLADQPWVASDHYRRLLTRHREAPQQLLATRHANVTGPPALFPRDCLADLAAWQGHQGAHALLEREAARLEPFAVAEHPDVDTPDDLARMRARPVAPPR